MKQAIGYLRQSTTKQQSLDKTNHRGISQNIIFNTLPFIAISNQDALISGTVTNKLLN